MANNLTQLYASLMGSVIGQNRGEPTKSAEEGNSYTTNAQDNAMFLHSQAIQATPRTDNEEEQDKNTSKSESSKSIGDFTGASKPNDENITGREKAQSTTLDESSLPSVDDQVDETLGEPAATDQAIAETAVKNNQGKE